MDRLDYIKSEIEKLYKTNPQIHISIKLARPRITVENAPAVITGTYRNIFQIEECDSGRPLRHSFQYVDVMIGQVVIRELNYTPDTNASTSK